MHYGSTIVLINAPSHSEQLNHGISTFQHNVIMYSLPYRLGEHLVDSFVSLIQIRNDKNDESDQNNNNDCRERSHDYM